MEGEAAAEADKEAEAEDPTADVLESISSSLSLSLSECRWGEEDDVEDADDVCLVVGVDKELIRVAVKTGGDEESK